MARFFLSYALPESSQEGDIQAAPTRWIRTFFKDLSEDVALMLPIVRSRDPGYLDLAESLRPGEPWRPELLSGLGTCQVFVPLLSTPYFSSTSCGMEWYAFSQRRVVSRVSGRPGGQSPIIPVLWSPVSDADVPAAVRTMQRFSPNDPSDCDLNAIYVENGIEGLLRMEMDAAYRKIIWKLARRISELAAKVHVESLPFNIGELRDAFWRINDEV